MSGIEARGILTTTVAVEVLSASRGKLTVRLNGVQQVVYAGGTLYVSATATFSPDDKGT